jgi:hypothetical protein
MRPDAPPTVRQVYALAAALCERAGETFPETRADASELIETVRLENGHPAPRLEDSPLRGRGGRRRRNPKTEAFAALARELRSRERLS